MLAVRGGRPWFEVLLETVESWEVPVEVTEEREYRYLYGGEAFDWLVLAQRLCDAGADAVPAAAGTEERTMTILEAETLTALQALSDDDEDLLQELVEIYLAEAPALIRAIRVASAESDAEGLERAAHSLKGSSANMGALRLAGKARALEELGRAGSVDGASELAADLDALFEEASGALANWLNAA